MADTLFSPKDFSQAELENFPIDRLDEKAAIVKRWQDGIINGKILSQKEEQLQFPFLEDLFGKILEYPYQKELTEYMLENEFKSFTDGKKPDGALGYFRYSEGESKADVRAVVELKDASTNLDRKQNRADFKGTPVEQAFSYVPKMGGNCKWVIVSNFLEVRFYHAQDISRYESFKVLELLQNGNLRRFIYLLQAGQLFLEKQSSRIDQLFEGRTERQKTISNDFYREYKLVREHLYYDIRKHNPGIAATAIFRCAQKAHRPHYIHLLRKGHADHIRCTEKSKRCGRRIF